MNNGYSFPVAEAQSLDKYFIIFTLKNKKYAINIYNVVEVINMPKIEIPEITPKGIIGIFNYNGLVIKAVDLCPFLGFSASSFDLNNKMIIVYINEEYFAIHTDNIETISKFEEEKIQNMPYLSEKSLLKQIYKTESENIHIINSDVLYEILLNKENQTSEINYGTLFPKDEKAKQILSLRAKNYWEADDIFSFPVDLQTSKQYILFIIDNQNYYMDIKYVKEFISIKRLNIIKLPYTQEYTAGIVSVKGEFLVVINLNKFLDKESKNEIKGGKLIVVEGRDFNIAFLVDDIKYIRNLKDISKSKIYSSNDDYVYAEFMEEGILYSILNFEKILNDERLYINIE